MSLKKWYDAIGTKNDIFDVKDVKEFKYATGILICNIVNLKKEDPSEELCMFCDNFQKEYQLSDEEAQGLYKDVQNFDQNLEKYIAVIKSHLHGSEHKKLDFMHTLNRFIIKDECDDQDYCVFEVIKEQLFS
ncbi:MAG: hypothetical protein K0U47_05235 [Epsilonproteobacteria bacterium]|nr:hypothetical protein [Campylobacterota bacterium]